MKPIKLAITDDDLLVLNLLHDYLHQQTGFQVLFKASSGEELLETLQRLEEIPDILLLDLKMQEMNGLEATEYIKTHYPSIRVIVVSSYYKTSFMGFMIKTGVAAFLPKGISPTELLSIIHHVYTNGYYLSEEQFSVVRGQISGNSASPALDEGTVLSEREREIILLICQQKTAKEIGEQLFITQRTVEGHKNNIFAKTGAKNIAGLVIYALQNQLLDPQSLPIIS